MPHNTVNSIWFPWFRPCTLDRPATLDYRRSLGPNRRTTHDCSCHRQSGTVRWWWSTARFPSQPCTLASWFSQGHNYKWSPRPNCSAARCEEMMRHTMKPISWRIRTQSLAPLRRQSAARQHSNPCFWRPIGLAPLECSQSLADCRSRGFLFCNRIEWDTEFTRWNQMKRWIQHILVIAARGNMLQRLRHGNRTQSVAMIFDLPQFLADLFRMRRYGHHIPQRKSQQDVSVAEPFVLQQWAVFVLESQFSRWVRFGQMIQIQCFLPQNHAYLCKWHTKMREIRIWRGGLQPARCTHSIFAGNSFVGFDFGEAHVAGHITQLDHSQRIAVFWTERQRLIIAAQRQNVISRPGAARNSFRMFAQNRYASEIKIKCSHRQHEIESQRQQTQIEWILLWCLMIVDGQIAASRCNRHQLRWFRPQYTCQWITETGVDDMLLSCIYVPYNYLRRK